VHLCSLMTQHRMGVTFKDIGYDGSAPPIQDMLAGTALPDVPTFAEAGFLGFELLLWNALYAPSGTPRPIIERLNGALRDALGDPAMRERFAGFGTELVPEAQQTPEAANARLQAEIRAIRETVRAMGVQPEG
jgi:tripartite-type tricarboxylate transporter receptor subunit TctC